MSLSKAELRERLKTERLQLSTDETARASREIAGKCIELIDWEHVRSLHIYVPVMAENEVDAWRVVEHAWQHYPTIHTAVPALNDSGNYDSIAITPSTTWQRKLRIPEPTTGEALTTNSQFDVIIVPMLGFDAGGHRLGHGKGWYDRFLATQKSALTIGVCYELGCVVGGLPHEVHDIALDYIITERQVHKIG